MLKAIEGGCSEFRRRFLCGCILRKRISRKKNNMHFVMHMNFAKAVPGGKPVIIVMNLSFAAY